MEHLYHYLALFLSIFLITKFLFHRNKNSPPGPFALPLIGHLHLLKQPLCQTLESLSLKHGPIFSLKFGCRSVLVLSSPSAVEECFAQNDVTFANRPRILASDYLTYNYTAFVWAPYGHVWRSLRRLSTTEILSQKSLQKFSAIREGQVCSFVRQVLKIIGNGTQKVDLQYLFSTLLFNIIMSVAAGKQCIEEEIATTILGKLYLQEMKDKFSASLTMCMCDFLPILRWVDYKQSKKSMMMLHRKRDEFLQGLIEEIRQKKSTPLNPTTALESEKRTTLIESLLQLQESDPECYSDIVVKATLLMMFVAGIETSVTTMDWTISLLLNHAEVLKKVREEIDCHVGPGRLLKDSDLPKLRYLHCVINETLRLYPVAPLLLPHSSSEDCSVGGFHIPRDTILMLNVWAIHRNPNIWDEPTKFKPERFEAMDGEKESFKFIPFGVGRRACPGAAMGIRTVSLALGTLIQCFDLERVGHELVDVNPEFGTTLRRNKPLEAVCSARHVMVDVLSQL